MNGDPPLHVAPHPCNTCPYSRATPPGIWHPDEYAKLPGYDEGADLGIASVATFHCHQENATRVPTVCRGWLGTHRLGIAVRWAQALGVLRPEDVPTEDDPSLYATGQEACDAGTRAADDVDDEARAAMAKLLAKGAGRVEP